MVAGRSKLPPHQLKIILHIYENNLEFYDDDDENEVKEKGSFSMIRTLKVDYKTRS